MSAGRPPAAWPDNRRLSVGPGPSTRVDDGPARQSHMAHGPSDLKWLTDRQSLMTHWKSDPGGSRAISYKWHTGRQPPKWLTGRQTPGDSRVVSPVWLTGRQSPSGLRAVSPRVAHGPSVPGWLTGSQSLVTRWSSVPGGSRAACPGRITLPRVRGFPCPQALMARSPGRQHQLARGPLAPPERLAGRQCHVAGPRSGQARGSLSQRGELGVRPRMSIGPSAPLTGLMLALVVRSLTLLSEAPP